MTVPVTCDNEECCAKAMELTNTDSRQEWVEETYECPECGRIKIHRTEFNQLGLVTSDEIDVAIRR